MPFMTGIHDWHYQIISNFYVISILVKSKNGNLYRIKMIDSLSGNEKSGMTLDIYMYLDYIVTNLDQSVFIYNHRNS